MKTYKDRTESGNETRNKKYTTVVIVENHIPAKGHYYHDITVFDAILSARQKGCHAAVAYCYDTVRSTHVPAQAIATIRVP